MKLEDKDIFEHAISSLLHHLVNEIMMGTPSGLPMLLFHKIHIVGGWTCLSTLGNSRGNLIEPSVALHRQRLLQN